MAQFLPKSLHDNVIFTNYLETNCCRQSIKWKFNRKRVSCHSNVKKRDIHFAKTDLVKKKFSSMHTGITVMLRWYISIVSFDDRIKGNFLKYLKKEKSIQHTRSNFADTWASLIFF